MTRRPNAKVGQGNDGGDGEVHDLTGAEDVLVSNLQVTCFPLQLPLVTTVQRENELAVAMTRDCVALSVVESPFVAAGG